MAEIVAGSRVLLRPTDMASVELQAKVKPLRDVACEVGAVSGIEVCTVLLPPGVIIEGSSHPLGNGQHFLDLHRSHLEVIA